MLHQIQQFIRKQFSFQLDEKMEKLLCNVIQVKLYENGIQNFNISKKDSQQLSSALKNIDFTQSMSCICDSLLSLRFEKPMSTSSKDNPPIEEIRPSETFNFKYLEHILVKYTLFKDKKAKSYSNSSLMEPKELNNVSQEISSEKLLQAEVALKLQHTSIESAFEEIDILTEDKFFKWAQKVIVSMSEEELQSFLSVIFNSFPKNDLLLPYLRRTGDVQWKDEKLFQIILAICNDKGLNKFKSEMKNTKESLTVKNKKGKSVVNVKAPVPIDPEMYSHLTSCLMTKDQIIKLNHSLYLLGIPKSDHITYILKLGLSIEPEQYDSCLDLLLELSNLQIKFNAVSKIVDEYENGLKKQRLFGNSKALLEESSLRKKYEKLYSHLKFQLGQLKKDIFENYNLEF
eukprot:NODE_624_length_5307_cov_0.437980.p2 type:complete len:401 gc:universal NODE_624_length_5307_cov_0.437980:4901-3699(-)